MLIKYEFADGTISEVEVSDEIGNEILNSRREEENLARKERYHCCPMEASKFEDEDYATPALEEMLFCGEEELNERVQYALSRLTPIQRRRLEMLGGGLSEREIARQEKASYYAIHKSILAAQKKFKKHF